jgi:predicted membrane channel-forming protein YqfA (hemolysin III family)
MIKRPLPYILAVLFALPFLIPIPVFAYGEEITNAGMELYKWMRGLGAVAMCIGLGGVAFKLMIHHDREGLKPFFYVIGGGLIMMLAPAIVGLIQNVAGGASAVNINR